MKISSLATIYLLSLATGIDVQVNGESVCKKTSDNELTLMFEPQTNVYKLIKDGKKYTLKANYDIWNRCSNEVLTKGSIKYDSTQNNKIAIPICVDGNAANYLQLCKCFN